MTTSISSGTSSAPLVRYAALVGVRANPDPDSTLTLTLTTDPDPNPNLSLKP